MPVMLCNCAIREYLMRLIHGCDWGGANGRVISSNVADDFYKLENAYLTTNEYPEQTWRPMGKQSS